MNKWCVALAGLVVLAAWPTVAAPLDVDVEIEFASALVTENYPEYAEAVVADLLARFPGDETILERTLVIRAQTRIVRRRFDEAEALLETLPPGSPRAEAIRLAIADGHYLAGNYDQSAEIYDAFFEKYAEETPSDPDLMRFFSEAAYRYAQMLILRDDPEGAARAYAHVLRVIGDEDEELLRKVRVERSELLLRAAGALPPEDETRQAWIETAVDLCEAVLWGGMDLWFGRAVISLAQSHMLRGDRDATVELLQTNLRMLRTVDGMLRAADAPLTESPLAGGRSLLGELNAAEADLLTGPAVEREAEALRLLDSALDAYTAVWEIMLRANRRDAQWLRRNPGKTPTDLPGQAETGTLARRPDRQAPFTHLKQALEMLHRRVASAPGIEGWDAGNRDRVQVLQTAIDGLANAVRTNRTADVGVKTTREMDLGETFAGRAALERVDVLMADEATRREEAIRRYTEALRHDYHVFVQYAGSPWARKSGPRVQRLKQRLETLTGREVTIEVGADSRMKSGLAMITEGRNLFRRNEYEQAAERLLAGLNIRPEGDHALGALANLLDCYARTDRPLHVRMLADYIAERLGEQAEAPRILLRIARHYFDREETDMYHDLYERYLRHFPGHYMAPSILFMLGEQRWAVENYDGAVPYYQRVVEQHAQSAEALRALNRIGWAHYLQRRHDDAVAVFAVVVERAPHGMMRAEARICLADALRQIGRYAEAIRHYRELSDALAAPGSLYQRTLENREQSARLREQALFYEAHCLSRINEPEDQIQTFRSEAIERFRVFVEAFPRSNLAPLALGSMGAVLLAADRSDEAAAVYDELAREYPESEAGRDARFAMVRSLLDIGQTRRAATELDRMLEVSDRYSARQFMRLGTLFHDARDPASAIRALDMALAKRDEPDLDDASRRNLEQRVRMLLGQSHVSLNQQEAAEPHLRHLIDHFPASAMFFEARFLLGKTYQAMGRPEDAIEVLRDVFRQASDQNLINRATLALGELQAERGEKREALASFQRIVLLEDPEHPETRPLYEPALARSVGLFVELEQWDDVQASADRYLQLFPSGAARVNVLGWRAQAVMHRGGRPGNER